jgi:FkbM family methyltransferase
MFFISKLNLWFEVPSNTIFSWHLSKYNTYETNYFEFLMSRFRLNQGGIFIDIGANFGWYSLIFSKFSGSTGKTISFEPDQKNFDLLTKNIKLNSAVGIDQLRIAIGEFNSEMILRLGPNTNPGMHSLVNLPQVSKDNADVVQVRRLDELIANYKGHIEILKIDIEGFEVSALISARETLKRCKVLLIEYSPNFIEKSGYKKFQFFELIQEAGFDIYEFEKNSLKILTDSDLYELSYKYDKDFFQQQDLVCINSQLN